MKVIGLVLKFALKNIFQSTKTKDLKFKNYPIWRIDKYNQQIISGGWHFSFLQSPRDIVRKIKSYSHGEFNTRENTDENIIEKILQNKDIFDRGFKLKKLKLIVLFQNIL